jgi:hypothetical protein
VSEWLLFNSNSAIFLLYHGEFLSRSYIIILLATLYKFTVLNKVMMLWASLNLALTWFTLVWQRTLLTLNVINCEISQRYVQVMYRWLRLYVYCWCLGFTVRLLSWPSHNDLYTWVHYYISVHFLLFTMILCMLLFYAFSYDMCIYMQFLNFRSACAYVNW